MGLSDDLPEDDLKAAEQNEAEQLAAAVLDATESGDAAAALEGLSDLLGALWELDADAFDGVAGYAEPGFHASTEWASVGVEARDYEGAAEIEVSTGASGTVSFWATIPEVEDATVTFDLTPASAMWLSEILPEFSARAQNGEDWEHLKTREDTDE